MEENNNNSTNHPGKILRAAREELGLSTHSAADELHLRVSVVEAIEEENYDEFSSDVFLKGYFRSYCRLVNLHEGRMVELLEQQLKIRQEHKEQQENEVRKLQRARKNKKIMINIGAVCLGVLILVAVFSYVLNDMDTAQKGNASPKAMLSTEVETSDAPAKEEHVSDVGEMVVAARPETEELSGENVIDTDDESGELEKDASDASTITVEQDVALPSVAEEIKPEDAPIVEPGTQDQESELLSVEVLFSGDCWYKLVDGNGKTVIAALKKQGDNSIYRGKAPFKLVLGDGSKAQVTMNGQPIDISKYQARNGRAQFSLPLDM